MISIMTCLPGHAADSGDRHGRTGRTGRQLLEAVSEAAEGKILGNAVMSISALSSEGDTIIMYNSRYPMVPASNVKLITTGAALHSLGGDYRYRTGIGYSGEVADGVLYGDLYITGGGDPTLGSRDSIATPLTDIFSQWLGYIADAGIKRIEGHVVGDDRFFDNIMEEDTWLWNDLGTYYGTGVSGLSFYENVQDFNVSAGERPGDPVTVSPGYPPAPWMEYRYRCTTGKAGTGNRLYYYTSSLAPAGEMRGTFAVDRKPKTEEGSNKFPAYTCARIFTDFLASNGISCTMGAADTGDIFGMPEGPADRDSLTMAGYTYSPGLRRIAFETNYESNNFFAETIFKTLGKKYCGGVGSYEDGRNAVRAILEELGISCDDVQIQDGSGLSRQNYISTGFMCRFLRTMLDSPASEDFLGTLPSPGDSGTMSFVMSGYPESIRSRILIKSGSMNGVLCYSGYILPESMDNDIVVFSIMTNNSTSTPYQVRKSVERILALLAGY